MEWDKEMEMSERKYGKDGEIKEGSVEGGEGREIKEGRSVDSEPVGIERLEYEF